jgi:Zn-dependent protease
MDISLDQVQKAIVSLIAFILSVAVHEFGHAWMANHLGDRLPAQQGRLTLWPMAHIDPLGTIVMPLVAAFMPGGFPLVAWGKPVQTNPLNYTKRISPRVGHMLVSLMGPAMNLVLAVLISLLLIALGRAGVLARVPQLAEAAIRYFVVLNLTLLFFNLIPLPPLDGGSVLAGLLPESLQIIPQFLRRYGTILFFVLLLSGVFKILMRPAFFVSRVWVGTLIGLMGV